MRQKKPSEPEEYKYWRKQLELCENWYLLQIYNSKERTIRSFMSMKILKERGAI